MATMIKHAFAVIMALAMLLYFSSFAEEMVEEASEEPEVISECIEEYVQELTTIDLEDLISDEHDTSPAREAESFDIDNSIAVETELGSASELSNRHMTISGNEKVSLRVGDTLEIDVAAFAVTSWSSSKKKVASVAYNGTTASVTAISPGTAKLTAKLSNRKKLTVAVTVVDPYIPTGISFSRGSLTIATGSTYDLSKDIVLEPESAHTTFTWKSSKSSIAKVDKNGLLSAKKAGTTMVTVTTKNKLKATLPVTVQANRVDGLNAKPTKADCSSVSGSWSLRPISVEITAKGEIECEFFLLNGTDQKSSQIQNLNLSIAVGTPSHIIAQKRFSMVKVSCSKRSSKPFKVTFPASSRRESNVFLPDYSGATYFDFIDDGYPSLKTKKGNFNYTPTVFPEDTREPERWISLDHEAIEIEVGKTFTLKASVIPDGSSSHSIVWKSSDNSIATVRNGQVNARAEGTADIIAELADGSGAMASCRVNVTKRSSTYVPVEGISLSYPALTVFEGQSITLQADILPVNATNRELIWFSSDTGVATVNKGIVQGIREGEMTITAYAADNTQIHAQLDMNVKPENNPRPIEPPFIAFPESSGNSISISWIRISDVVGYRLYYRRSTDQAWSHRDFDGSAHRGTINDLNYDTEYIMSVTAILSNGSETGFSNQEKVRTEQNPNGETDKPWFHSITPSGDCVRIEWEPVSGATRYDVYYRLDGMLVSGFVRIADPAQTSCVVSGLNRDASYGFRVIPYFGNTQGKQSDEIFVKTQRTGTEVLGASIILKSIDLAEGDICPLDILTQPAEARYRSCYWYSYDTSIATVNNSGVVTGISNGTTTIGVSVTALSGWTCEASCKVTVKAATYRALLIGECTFSGKNDLPGAKDEVAKLKKMLTSRRGPNGGSWKIETRIDRTADQIHQDIRNALGSASECDTSLFFISCHGSTNGSYDNPLASSLSCYKGESIIKPSELAKWLSEVPGKVIVIISSCGSGGFIAENPAIPKSGDRMLAEAAQAFDPATFNKAIERAFIGYDTESFEIFSKAGDLRDVRTSQSRENKFYVLTASRFQETAFLGRLVGWLTDGVGTSGSMPADVQYAGNRDGLLTLHEIYTYISKEGDNTPILSSEDKKYHYQHVCCYPQNSSFVLFRK